MAKHYTFYYCNYGKLNTNISIVIMTESPPSDRDSGVTLTSSLQSQIFNPNHIKGFNRALTLIRHVTVWNVYVLSAKHTVFLL